MEVDLGKKVLSDPFFFSFRLKRRPYNRETERRKVMDDIIMVIMALVFLVLGFISGGYIYDKFFFGGGDDEG